jgi:hypothetical protein
MLSVTAATIAPATQFTLVITVTDESVDPTTGETTLSPSTSVPSVTASFTDPGIVITPAVGQVTISGMYKTIIQTNWTYLTLTGASVTSPQAPDLGTFKTITKVDSPANLTELCTYSIGSNTFTHTVDLVSYSGIGDLLKSLLATVP